MSNTKRLAVLVVAVCIGILTGLIFAATRTAATFGYNPRIFGTPLFAVANMSIYPPQAILQWMFRFQNNQAINDVLTNNFNLSLLIMLIPIGIAIPIAMRKTHKIDNVHGSSRWALESELEKMGLLTNKGAIIGKYMTHRGMLNKKVGRYLTHDGKEHILAFAPTRSGKGVGLVVPSLLTWKGSTIVHDLKGENWDLTAGFRSHLGPVLYFNPGSPDSIHYNPLDSIRLGINETKDTQMITDILVDPEGSSDKMDHWAKTGHALLVGCILHVLYADTFRVKSLRTVADLLSDPNKPAEDVFEDMISYKHFNEPHPIYGDVDTHPVVAACAREILNKAPNERSGVISTAMSFLSLYRDPIVASNTSSSDFTVEDLMEGPKPVSLYLVVPPPDASRTKSLMRLILQQICRRLTEQLHKPKHRMLLMLDEFPALGRLDFFESALAFLAGYEIKAYLITQSLNQLEKAYGQNNSILDNCHVRVAYAPNDERTAKRISELLGTTTVEALSRSESGKKFSMFLSQKSLSYSLVGRPLLTPGEIMQLEADRELIFIANQPPVKAWKMRYYEEPQWNKLTQIPTPKKPRSQAIRSTNDTDDPFASEKILAAAIQSTTEDTSLQEDSDSAATSMDAEETRWVSGTFILYEHKDSIVKVVKTRTDGEGQQESRTDYHLVRSEPMLSETNIILVSLRQQTPNGTCIDMYYQTAEPYHADYFRGIPDDKITVERRAWTLEDPTGILDTLSSIGARPVDKITEDEEDGTSTTSEDYADVSTEEAPEAERTPKATNNGHGRHVEYFTSQEISDLAARVRTIMRYRGLSQRATALEINNGNEGDRGRTLGKLLTTGKMPSKNSQYAQKLLAWLARNEENMNDTAANA